MSEWPNKPNNSKKFSAPKQWDQTNQQNSSKSHESPRQWDPWQGGQQPQQNRQRPQQDQWQSGQQYAQQNQRQGGQQYAQQNQWQGGQQYAQQDSWQNNGAEYRYDNAGGSPTPPRKKNTGLIIGIVVLAVLLMLASGLFTYFMLRNSCKESGEKTDPNESSVTVTNPPVTNPPVTNPPVTNPPVTNPPVTNPPVTNPPVTNPPELQYPVFKNGRRVTSASELSRFDRVTFGNYPQTSMGFDAPIEWYVINVEGNKVQLLSVYCLDSMPFHNKNEEVRFKSSDLYRWLNGSFRERAFNADEQAMLAREILLPNKAEAFKLPQSYRAATGTDHAISQGYNDKQNIWWLGDDSKVTYSYDYWDVAENNCALAMIADGSDAWEFKVTFNGKGIRPMIVIQF